MTTTLIIARHGNTFEDGETPRRVGSRTDLPLTEKGRRQAHVIGEWLKNHNLVPDLAFCSNLQRTHDTAQAALQAAGADIAPHPEDMFDEIDYGHDENKTEEEVIARIGAQAISDWDRQAVVPPGWNVDTGAIIRDWLSFGQRIAGELDGLTVLAVTSNGIARFAPYLTGDFEGFQKNHNLKIATGALCRLEVRDYHWTVTDWNIRPPV